MLQVLTLTPNPNPSSFPPHPDGRVRRVRSDAPPRGSQEFVCHGDGKTFSVRVREGGEEVD